MRMHAVRYMVLITMVVLGLVGMTYTAFSADASANSAIRTAARQNRYIFVTFYRPNDGASQQMLAVVQTIQGKLANRADFVSVDMTNTANRSVITRFGADRSPVPLTIVVAPNGAVTAGYPRTIDANGDFTRVFVSRGQADVLKVLQAGKLAVVCVQNGSTHYNHECAANASALKADSRFGSAVVIVRINPADREEAGFLQQNNINTGSGEAQLVVFAPPGRIIGTFTGNTLQATVVANVQRSLGGGCCNGHCGPNGCH